MQQLKQPDFVVDIDRILWKGSIGSIETSWNRKVKELSSSGVRAERVKDAGRGGRANPV